MARSPISNLFARLLADLQPTEAALAQARAHARSIESRLRDRFHLKKFEIVGSHARETAISPWSDVDYFAVLNRDEARWGGSYVRSDTLLTRVRDELAERFPATSLRRSGSALVVEFARGDFPVDVVPAIYGEPHESGWPIYEIPDGCGEWLSTSPGYHNAFIRSADEASRGRFLQVARLLRFWRHTRSAPIPVSSFYMEIALAVSETCNEHATTRKCLAAAFSELSALDADPIDDPLEIGDEIVACRTPAQLDATATAFDRAADWARDAVEAEANGDNEEAQRRWEQVFNRAFAGESAIL